MGDGGKCSDEYGSDSAVTGDGVKCGGSDSAALQKQYLGSDVGNYEGAGGVPPSGGLADIRDNSSTSRGGGIGVVIGGGCLGGGGTVVN